MFNYHYPYVATQRSVRRQQNTVYVKIKRVYDQVFVFSDGKTRTRSERRLYLIIVCFISNVTFKYKNALKMSIYYMKYRYIVIKFEIIAKNIALSMFKNVYDYNIMIKYVKTKNMYLSSNARTRVSRAVPL